MSPSVAERTDTENEPEILQPIRLEHKRRRSFFGYVALYTRRATAYAVYGLAILLTWLIVSPVLPDQYAFPPLAGESDTSSTDNAEAAAPTTTQAKLPARPQGVPARIPSWAWSMHKWLLTAPQERGARPEAAPAHLPSWFWDWRTWRLQLEKH